MPPLEEEAVVGDILGEGVPEHIFQFGKNVFLRDQFRFLEGFQGGGQRALRIPDFIQNGVGEFAADDRGQLKGLFHRFLQPVDPGHDDVLDVGGNARFRFFFHQPAYAPLGADMTALDEVQDEFLREHRISLGLALYEVFHLLRHLSHPQHAVQHLFAFPG